MKVATVCICTTVLLIKNLGHFGPFCWGGLCHDTRHPPLALKIFTTSGLQFKGRNPAQTDLLSGLGNLPNDRIYDL